MHQLNGIFKIGGGVAGALFGGREGGAYLGDGPVRGGGGTKLNVRANGLNSKEAHEVTYGHNAHYSKDREDTVTITKPFTKIK